jgi:hypothetical protein
MPRKTWRGGVLFEDMMTVDIAHVLCPTDRRIADGEGAGAGAR